MWKLFQIELYKIFKRPRTYIAFGVITLIIVLVQIGLMSGKEDYVGMMMSGLNESFEAPPEQVLNGYSVCFIILTLLPLVDQVKLFLACREERSNINIDRTPGNKGDARFIINA